MRRSSSATPSPTAAWRSWVRTTGWRRARPCRASSWATRETRPTRHASPDPRPARRSPTTPARADRTTTQRMEDEDVTDTSDTEYRIEHDTMGEVRVPRNALYAAQTQRAVENFPISGD